MRIIECAQGTPEWFSARVGLPTASEMDALVSPKFKIREGEGVNAYLAKKLAERWLGHPLQAWTGSGAAEQGSIREDEAVPFLELEWGVEIWRPGFLTTDDVRIGCSPDGMITSSPEVGVEIKCPEPHTHVAWLLAGGLPDVHVAQVHGSLFVTGLPEWKFVSYCRNFPPLVVTIKRSDEVMETFGDALEYFLERFDTAWKHLVELNGGREPERNQGETLRETVKGWT